MSRTTAPTLALALLGALLTGCPTTEPCPGARCVDAASPDDDGGAPDAPAPDDAGPCGGACEGETPRCDALRGACVACLDASDCAGRPGTPACVEGACVACASDADCADPARAACDLTTHTCGPCAEDAACAHLEGTPACDAGTCVGCVDNADCAASEGCEPARRACRAFSPGAAGLCAPCVRDAECQAGQRCVPMAYDDPATAAADPVDVGAHCLFREEATGPGAPGGDCFAFRPYVRSAAVTSVDGEATSVCTLRVSTCEALADYSSTRCSTLDSVGDAECGAAGVPDGVCRMAGATANLCTVYCVSDLDCPPGVTCNTAAVPRVCNF